jgi:hypothetical protein
MIERSRLLKWTMVLALIFALGTILSANVHAQSKKKSKSKSSTTSPQDSGPSLSETQEFIKSGLGQKIISQEQRVVVNDNDVVQWTRNFTPSSTSTVNFFDNKMEITELTEAKGVDMVFVKRNSAVGRAGDSQEHPYYKSYKYISSVRISELSSEVKVEGKNIKVNCSSGECFSFHRTDWDGKISQGKTGNQNYEAVNEDTAQRLAKAFSHLIKLHGGKKSLF